MKRKSYRRDPLRIQTSPDGDFHGITIPEKHIKSREISADGPKTSEYAFFKSLKKDAGQTCHSNPVPKDDNHIKKSKSSDCTGEFTNIVRHSFNNLKSSFPFENDTLRDLDSFPSSMVDPSKNTETSNMVNHNSKSPETTVYIHNVMPVNFKKYFSPLREQAKNLGTQFQQDGVFSAKRQRLRQWVADTASAEPDDLSSKGIDIVSKLLARLFPKSNDDNLCGQQKLGEEDIDTESELTVACPEFDINFNKPYWSKMSKYIEREVVSCLDDDVLTCLFDQSRKADVCNKLRFGYHVMEPVAAPYLSTMCTYTEPEVALHMDDGLTRMDDGLKCLPDQSRKADFSTWDRENTHSLNNFSHNFHFQYQMMEPFDALYDNYQSYSSPNFLEEVRNSYHSNDISPSRQPPTLLLGWNSEDTKDSHGLFVASDDMELSLYPALPVLWSTDYFRDSNRIFDTSGLPSLVSNLHTYSSRPPRFSVPLFYNLKFERKIFEDEKDLNLALSHQVEDFNNDTASRDSNIFFSPQNHNWPARKIFRNNYHPAMDSPLVSPGLNCSLEHLSTLKFCQEDCSFPFCINKENIKTCLDDLTGRGMHNHFSRGKVGFFDWSPITFQISLEKDKSSPLPLDKFSWDEYSRRETNFDDYE